jgi:phenylpropionate dioxygenase-like ring-hydroxylating dioxygenase large terminal subunit
MALVTNLTASFGSNITTTGDTPVQCRSGYVWVNWAPSAPSDVTDSHLLGPGDVIVIPDGNTFRMAAANGTSPVVQYQAFA